MSIFTGLFARRTRHPAPSTQHPAPLRIRRDFEAGSSERLFADWSGDYGITADELRSKLPLMRNRSRKGSKDDPYLKKWLSLCKINIVGPDGLRLRMNVRDPISGNVDEMANRTITQGWRQWSTNPAWVDAAGKKDFKALCDLVVMYWHRDGEAIIRLLPGFGWPDNPFAFSVKVYRPDALDLNYNITFPDGRRISCGVETNQWDRPAFYHFVTNFDSYNNRPAYYGANHAVIPASEIVHFFTPDDEDQPRGVPMAHAALVTMKMSDGYDEAELVAARESACVTQSYEAEDSQDIEPTSLSGDDVVQDREPGQSIVLPRGWKHKLEKPEHPNAVYEAFKKAVLRRMGNGLLLNYNSIANDLSDVNYTSLREGKLSEQDVWKCSQASLISGVARRIFSAWLKAWLSTGNTVLPISKLQKFDAPVFRGRRWPWVDPLKDAQASEVNVAHGWETDSQVTEDLGNDYGENIIVAQADAALRKGTVLEHLNSPKTKPATPPADEPDPEPAPAKGKPK